MSEAFRDISPEAPELQPIISGLFAEYAAPLRRLFFPRCGSGVK
ncbi:N-acetyltransferase GCN5 [Klebsiella pneumoniae]|uniref:N-acetyltransferase GCN5 n=1 Tax=Klebsiella pneumoniae TaxID=573 RepID=A0A2X3EGW6_KLEPN|nr:N-acetyltransferase GCN5 [Klebsiella pneumoniae]